MKKKRKQEKGQLPTKIVVERVYLGGQSMEDAFHKINEETVKGYCSHLLNPIVQNAEF